MTFNEADWGRFVARSALLLGVAGLALMAIFIAVLPVDPSEPTAELVAAVRNPAVYRVAALLDMLAWFGIGGVLLAFGGYFAARAPIRALVLAAAGAGQVIGALGGYMRLGVVSDLAVRYVTAAPDQRVTPSSDRAHGLEAEHWRERAIVWRERAMAAELVAKMLQRNLDDLRANLEDLREEVEALSTAEAERTAAIASSEPPWRRFVRDIYDKYVR